MTIKMVISKTIYFNFIKTEVRFQFKTQKEINLGKLPSPRVRQHDVPAQLCRPDHDVAAEKIRS